jgi:hypothetical protein
MAVVPVKINALSQYLKTVSANQIKTTQSSTSNKFSLVNAVSSTSSYLNINVRTAPINQTTTTGTITITQPVINPIPTNNSNAFIQTNNNQVSVTSKGADDTIISSILDNIINIEDVTNSGYTKNNSVSNLYDSISSNYWNPQVNIGNANPYFYKLNYTFIGTNKIFKFVIKNDNDFPGFTNIRLYPTSNPSNYIDIEPSIDTNNQYVNQTVALLIDGNGEPLFDTNNMTAEFELNPAVQPDTYYQYGQAYGVIYNTDTLGLRAGNYVNTNTGGSGIKSDWSYKYLENKTTATGTNNTDNNYLVSIDGVYRIAQNRTFYQLSDDNGQVFIKKTLITSSNMKSTPNGEYVMVTNNTTGYISNDYGNTFNLKSLDTEYVNYPYFDILYTGQYQMFVSIPKYIPGPSLSDPATSEISIYKNENYGSGSFLLRTASIVLENSFRTLNIINTIVKTDGTLLLVLNARYLYYEGIAYGIVMYASQPAGGVGSFTIDYPFSIGIPTLLYALEQNYSNDINQGQYKTGFGIYNFGGISGSPCFFVTTNDSSYTIYNNPSLYPEYYYGISEPSQNIRVRYCNIKISNDGSKQIAIIQWSYTFLPTNPDLIICYYSTDSGNTWERSSTQLTLLNTFSNIVANSDFSLIQACGGYYYNYKGQYRTDPITYISTNYGNTWTINSDINPASSIVYTEFFTAKSITNKTYFQVKDLNQTQVLGISDNGFNMTKDLRVNNSNAYVLGGTLTIGPDEASGLLNDYSVNIDGTISARNIVLLSDERFKDITNNVNSEDAYNKINKLKIIKYKFKDRPDDDREYTGMIAQHVKEVIDDVVDINSSTYETTEGIINIDNIYSINYTSMVSYLISTLQFTNIKLKLLEEKIKLKFNNN